MNLVWIQNLSGYSAAYTRERIIGQWLTHCSIATLKNAGYSSYESQRKISLHIVLFDVDAIVCVLENKFPRTLWPLHRNVRSSHILCI